MFESDYKSSAELVAIALTASWRASGATPKISRAELNRVAPLLMQTGAGALVWWRIRNSPLADSEAAGDLQQVYRFHRLEASLHWLRIRKVLGSLRAAGIEPVLVKGWNVARLYPEPGLRHYLDIDLCVPRDRFLEARQIAASLGEPEIRFDLHDELDHLDSLSWDEFWARTQLVKADNLEIRVPCAEDHLRILCTHWLRHGAWRPAGLCDIAASLESRPLEFDWQRCLGADPVCADWIACTIGLAHHLLGAGRAGIPSEVWQRTTQLPSWLAPAVLRQWERGLAPNYREPALTALLGSMINPKKFFDELYARWDQPVRATVALHRRFSNWPRLPLQFFELLMHSNELPKQLAAIWRERIEAQHSESAAIELAKELNRKAA